jgi:hypothetical protein
MNLTSTLKKANGRYCLAQLLFGERSIFAKVVRGRTKLIVGPGMALLLSAGAISVFHYTADAQTQAAPLADLRKLQTR